MLRVSLAILNLIFIPAVFSTSLADLKSKTRKQEFGTCDPVCQAEINALLDYTTSLDLQQNEKYDKLLQQVIALENDYFSTVDRISILIQQVNNLEDFLITNVSVINARISDEVRRVLDITATELGIVSGDIYSKLNDLTSEVNTIKFNQNNNNNNIPVSPVNSGAATEVYFNLTRRIDSIEYGRLANLTADNNIWRRNFRVVNATFEKMKNNNCLCK